jgi:hypothetical protein
MKSTYHFIIPNNSKALVIFSNIILLLFPALFFLLSYFIPTEQKSFINAGITLLAMLLVYLIFKKLPWAKNMYTLLYFFAAVFLFKKTFILPGLIIIVLCLLHIWALAVKSIFISQHHVQLNPPLGKRYDWNALQNVVLKDGLLTLDFKNNKLLQTPISIEHSKTDTKQFNDFCQERLKA